jgi:hypothetical protein
VFLAFRCRGFSLGILAVPDFLCLISCPHEPNPLPEQTTHPPEWKPPGKMCDKCILIYSVEHNLIFLL